MDPAVWLAGWKLNHPVWLWGLAAIPLLVFARHRLARRDVIPFAPLQLRPARADRRRRWLGIAYRLLDVVLLTGLLVALADPYRTSSVEMAEDEGIDLMLVLDISLSMLAEDFPPNRLAALRELAQAFVDSSGGHRIGLVIFAKDPHVHSPLTTDRTSLVKLLDSVTVYTVDQSRSGGTAIGDAMLVAIEQLSRNRIPEREQALILITDGESNNGIDPVLAARWAREEDIRVYSIGIGSTEPVAVTFEGRPVGQGDDPYMAVLDDQQLRAIADAADGRFDRATDADALGTVLAELARLESAPLARRTLEIRHPIGHGVAFALLPLLAAWLILGGTVLRRPLR